ncbi:MAG: CoA-binding protein [Deltaproteobacteria bacterium CG11_big_fil_rev_8_21_14_0_20_45_16]|nr:MAG: CoA-binding protein [Deltaproteobacteria bacterium CG11_big_fil_rev_8_21_14_0_20_45_16]
MKQNVAVLGASSNPERYSNKAVRMLLESGHQVFPIHPIESSIEGLQVFPSLERLPEKMDSLSIYIGPQHIGPLIPSIIQAKPGRVILNPGTESEELEKALQGAGIPYMEACTLVLLRTNQF